MSRRVLLVGLWLLIPTAAPAVPVERVLLRPVEIRGCEGIPFPRGARELWIAGERLVDARARYWVLDRPASYRNGEARIRYRMGEGTLRVDAQLEPGLETERVQIAIERPIDEAYLRVYLPGVALPCERQVRYEVFERGTREGDLDALARFDELLHEANELLYDSRFAEVDARLLEAAELRPDDPSPWWMRARSHYLELEQVGERMTESERIEAYEAMERWADEAVRRTPDRAEGYLWQGIARGRIATTQGNVRMAVLSAVGGRGPAWLESTLTRAVSRQPEYDFFGFSTRADALHALAQFYRFAPDAWYMAVVGTRGNISRSIALSREAVRIQPVRIEYRKELAVELLCRGEGRDYDEARQELLAVLALPAITPTDRIDHAQARQLLENAAPDDICWYTRAAEARATP